MAIYLDDVSRTFGEYLLIPGLTTKQCIPTNVSLKTPLVKYKKGEKSAIELNIPFVSAIMQSVSDSGLAIALARNGGLSFIFGSQPIESQAEMVRKVKKFKAGFVTSDSNITPEATLADVLALVKRTGHTTMGVTHDGTPNGKLLGIVTSRDYRGEKDPKDRKVKEFMTPFSKLTVGEIGMTLSEANQIIWDHKLNTLPIIDKDQNLAYFVFRKDYDSHKDNPNELLNTTDKKLLVGAGINSRDYKERVPALVEAGVDVLCIDSSDGFSEWQKETLQWIKQEYNGKDSLMEEINAKFDEMDAEMTVAEEERAADNDTAVDEPVTYPESKAVDTEKRDAEAKELGLTPSDRDGAYLKETAFGTFLYVWDPETEEFKEFPAGEEGDEECDFTTSGNVIDRTNDKAVEADAKIALQEAGLNVVPGEPFIAEKDGTYYEYNKETGKFEEMKE